MTSRRALIVAACSWLVGCVLSWTAVLLTAAVDRFRDLTEVYADGINR